MAEEVVTPTPPVEPVVEPKIEDDKLDTRLAALEKTFQEQKQINDGINRRNSELEKELEAEKKAHMKDGERLEYENQQKEQALKDRETRVLELEQNTLITNKLAAEGIDLSAMKLMVKPSADEEVDAWIANVKSLISELVEQTVNENLTRGPKPKSGATLTLVKPLNTKEDAMNATPEEQLAYLEKNVGDD